MHTLTLNGTEYVLRCDLNVIDKIERRFVSVDACRKIAMAGAVGSAAATKFLCAEMINEHFAAAGDPKRVTEEEIGRALGGNIAPVLAEIFGELADCLAQVGK
jgi:hypothetical protein